MSEHQCVTLDPGCFRCDLNRDEMETDRLDHERVAKLLRRVASNSRRRPGTRSLLLDLAAEATEHAQAIQEALSGSNRRSVALSGTLAGWKARRSAYSERRSDDRRNLRNLPRLRTAHARPAVRWSRLPAATRVLGWGGEVMTGPIEVTTRYATSGLPDLAAAWSFVMAHVDLVGKSPRIEIGPVWSQPFDDRGPTLGDDQPWVQTYSAVVSGMSEQAEATEVVGG